MKNKDYYCENCFKEHLYTYYEDSLGKIFCDKKCYKESLDYRDVKDETLEGNSMTCMICKKKSKYILEVCVRTHTLYADGNIEDSDTDSSYLIVNTCKKHKKKVLNTINTYVSNVINGFNLEED